MKAEDAKVFDEQFDKLLAGCTKEVREILEPQREELKALANKLALDIKATDDMLRRRLGPWYPFVFPYADKDEVPFYDIRPKKRG
jgi:hypothetical protein